VSTKGATRIWRWPHTVNDLSIDMPSELRDAVPYDLWKHMKVVHEYHPAHISSMGGREARKRHDADHGLAADDPGPLSTELVVKPWKWPWQR